MIWGLNIFSVFKLTLGANNSSLLQLTCGANCSPWLNLRICKGKSNSVFYKYVRVPDLSFLPVFCEISVNTVHLVIVLSKGQSHLSKSLM